AQKQQHHQSGENGAEQALVDQAANGAQHVTRLVEFETDVHIVRNHFLEGGQRRFHAVDDIDGGGVGALGDLDIHGAASVHLRIASDDVGSVFHHADIAQVDGRAGSGADRGGGQLL